MSSLSLTRSLPAEQHLQRAAAGLRVRQRTVLVTLRDMRVADVMSRAAVAEAPTDSLVSAADTMWAKQTGSLLVMEGDELLGIVTERDVMKAVARGHDLSSTPISAVMTTNVLTVTPDTSLHEAARHMADRWIRHLPVIVDGKVAGMVSQRDLCGAFAAAAPDD